MEPTVYISPWYKRKILWVFVLILILVPLGAYVYATYFMKSSSPKAQLPAQIQGKIIEEDKLPIAVDILQNPMVYEWRGSVIGTITAKDDHSITLADDQNHTLTITVIPSTDVIYGTKFHKKETKDNREQFVEVNHQDLPIGTKLRGDFFVAAKEKDKKIGSSFEIIE